MIYVMVDIEADGPCPGLYSMTELGAVLVDHRFLSHDRFYANFSPISNAWQPEALAVTGRSRDATLQFTHPSISMNSFNDWLKSISLNFEQSLKFLSDNVGFDWQFVNYYFWRYVGKNPFGHSGMDISSLYKGMVKDVNQRFDTLRITQHTHNPVDDALGNAEALVAMQEMGLKIGL